MSKSNKTDQPKLKDAMSSAVFFKLREDILDGDFKAGEKLKIASLKERYDTGHSPIREALSRLLPEGLVEREDQKGYRVRPLDPDDLFEITKMRCWLEDIAIRESIRLGDANWEESVVLALHRLNKAERYMGEDNQTPDRNWMEMHRLFHAAVVSACESSWLITYIQNLQRLTERYRRNNLSLNFQVKKPVDEHQAIVDAIINRDADLASELLMKHNRRTSDMISESLEQKKLEESDSKPRLKIAKN